MDLLVTPLQCAEQHHREGARILCRVGKVLSAPTGGRAVQAPVLEAPPDPLILDQALPQPNQTWHGNQERNHEYATAVAIRHLGGVLLGEDHTEDDEEVAEYLGIAGEHIGKEDVAELAFGGGGETTDRDTAKRCQEAVAADEGDLADGNDEAEGEEEEVYIRKPVPV